MSLQHFTKLLEVKCRLVASADCTKSCDLLEYNTYEKS